MKAVLHPLVHSDIFEAMEFYGREGGSKLAADFFREFERSVATIEQRPLSFSFFTDILRRRTFKRFPFHLLFSIEDPYLFVYVVRHDRRDPEFGLDRIALQR
jgi:hypothetical protein